MDIENINTSNLMLSSTSNKTSTPSKVNTKSNVTPVASLNVRPKTTPNAVTLSNLKSSKMAMLQPKTPGSPNGSISSVGSYAREAALQAKLQNTAEKQKKTKELKEKWALEKKEKSIRNKEKRENEIKKLVADSLHAAELRKRDIQLRKNSLQKEKSIQSEQLAASLEERTLLAQDLERKMKEKKRQSMMINKKIFKLAKDKEIKIQNEQKNIENENLALRRIDALEVKQSKLAEKNNRRESMVNRGHIAKSHLRITAENKREKAAEEKSLLESRHLAWVDTKNARALEAAKERESLANRLEENKLNKSFEEDVKIEKQKELQDSFTIRHENWLDVNNYKQQLVKKGRESLAGRLDKWREEKNYDEKLKADKQEADEYEQLLNMQAIEDMKSYEEKQVANRKQSLCYRLDKHRQDKDIERGQLALQAAIKEEELRIAELDRQDVNNYKESLLTSRRQSLAFRGQADYQEKIRQEGENQIKLSKEESDRELNEAAWRDVKEYQMKQRELERKEIADQMMISRKANEISLNIHNEKLNDMHRDLESNRLGWTDVQAAKAEWKERSRKSMSLRIDSWKQQSLAESMLASRKQMEEQEDARLREQDREDLENAKILMNAQERIKNINPFNF
jgi:hypothetical protein